MPAGKIDPTRAALLANLKAARAAAMGKQAPVEGKNLGQIIRSVWTQFSKRRAFVLTVANQDLIVLLKDFAAGRLNGEIGKLPLYLRAQVVVMLETLNRQIDRAISAAAWQALVKDVCAEAEIEVIPDELQKQVIPLIRAFKAEGQEFERQLRIAREEFEDQDLADARVQRRIASEAAHNVRSRDPKKVKVAVDFYANLSKEDRALLMGDPDKKPRGKG